jgi:membrane-bound lytic murein transglycosylase MltF
MGLLQLMPETAKELGCMEPFNPDECLKAGTTYLAQQLANVKLTVGSQPVAQDDLYRFALVSFNAGFGYVKAALRDLASQNAPIDWPHFKATFPTASVRGKKPDAKQALGYAEKILPLGD